MFRVGIAAGAAVLLIGILAGVYVNQRAGLQRSQVLAVWEKAQEESATVLKDLQTQPRNRDGWSNFKRLLETHERDLARHKEDFGKITGGSPAYAKVLETTLATEINFFEAALKYADNPTPETWERLKEVKAQLDGSRTGIVSADSEAVVLPDDRLVDAAMNRMRETIHAVKLAEHPKQSPARTVTVSSGSRPRYLPLSTQARLDNSDLEGKSAWELDIMRNEIYARHGRKFVRRDLRDYFARQAWYEPRDDFSISDLSAIEKRNADFIAQYQQRNGLFTR